MALIPFTAGLVLAGGRSSRFGVEKSVQMLGGRTLLERSLATLDEICDEVAVSAAAGSEAEVLARRLGRMSLTDDPSHADGPLAGVAAGLIWAASKGYAHLATLPCDTPLVDAAAFERLRPLGHALTADGPQALCAIWPTAAGADLAARLAAGNHPPVRAFLAEIGIRPVLFEDAGPFANVNTPEDLARLASGN